MVAILVLILPLLTILRYPISSRPSQSLAVRPNAVRLATLASPSSHGHNILPKVLHLHHNTWSRSECWLLPTLSERATVVGDDTCMVDESIVWCGTRQFAMLSLRSNLNDEGVLASEIHSRIFYHKRELGVQIRMLVLPFVFLIIMIYIRCWYFIIMDRLNTTARNWGRLNQKRSVMIPHRRSGHQSAWTCSISPSGMVGLLRVWSEIGMERQVWRGENGVDEDYSTSKY